MEKPHFFSVISALGVMLAGPAVLAQTEVQTEAPAAAPAEAPAPEASSLVSDRSVEMRELEERVNDLKERIFRSKARLMLLRETVLNGAIAGAKAIILHKNEMGSSFVLEKVTYALDGAPIFTRANDENDSLADAERLEVFAGSIVPGNHNLSVQLVFRGNGFGVFSYLKGYRFTIRSSYAFTAEEGKATTISVVPYEKGGMTTDLRERPAVRYDVEVRQDQPGETTSNPGAAPATN